METYETILAAVALFAFVMIGIQLNRMEKVQSRIINLLLHIPKVREAALDEAEGDRLIEEDIRRNRQR